MSNLEHLIENAIVAIKSDKDINDFKSVVYNQVMLNKVTATAEEIWEMASYVIYTLCACCDEKIMHGKWLHRNNFLLNRTTCSECGVYFDMLEVDRYCPNCGAKMDGGSNER